MDKGERLYEGIGKTDLFEPSELLGNVGFRLSGHSSPNALIPAHWRLSSLADTPKCELALAPVSYIFRKIYKIWHYSVVRISHQASKFFLPNFGKNWRNLVTFGYTFCTPLY